MSKMFAAFALIVLLLHPIPAGAVIPDNLPFDVNADSALLMDTTTGTVLYAKNADQALPPASVTKIMTLLLFMEEIDAGNISLDDIRKSGDIYETKL